MFFIVHISGGCPRYLAGPYASASDALSWCSADGHSDSCDRVCSIDQVPEELLPEVGQLLADYVRDRAERIADGLRVGPALTLA